MISLAVAAHTSRVSHSLQSPHDDDAFTLLDTVAVIGSREEHPLLLGYSFLTARLMVLAAFFNKADSRRSWDDICTPISKGSLVTT